MEKIAGIMGRGFARSFDFNMECLHMYACFFVLFVDGWMDGWMGLAHIT